MPDATILVADDDLAIRTVLSEALSRAGYQVHTTSNASTLWTWVTEGEGDLVLTDVVMPDGDGLELLPRMRRVRPDLPIIVMSARNTLATAVKATQGGAYEYLPKPFDIKDLQSIINAKKYFNFVMSSYPNTEYAVDSEFKLALIISF